MEEDLKNLFYIKLLSRNSIIAGRQLHIRYLTALKSKHLDFRNRSNPLLALATISSSPAIFSVHQRGHALRPGVAHDRAVRLRERVRRALRPHAAQDGRVPRRPRALQGPTAGRDEAIQQPGQLVTRPVSGDRSNATKCPCHCHIHASGVYLLRTCAIFFSLFSQIRKCWFESNLVCSVFCITSIVYILYIIHSSVVLIRIELLYS